MLPLTIVSLVPQVGRVPKGADENGDVVFPVCILNLKDDVDFREKWRLSQIHIIRQVESQPICRDLRLDIEAFDRPFSPVVDVPISVQMSPSFISSVTGIPAPPVPVEMFRTCVEISSACARPLRPNAGIRASKQLRDIMSSLFQSAVYQQDG